MPNHQLCSICHETDENAVDVLECSYCHTRKDNIVDALATYLVDKVKFGHEPHREKKCTDCHYNGEQLKNRMPDDPDSTGPPMPTCDLCHPDPDAGRFAATPAMPFCTECHREMGESRTRCAVCHDKITKKTVPTHHAGVRILHDDLKRWQTAYGKVYEQDPTFCSRCHEDLP